MTEDTKRSGVHAAFVAACAAMTGKVAKDRKNPHFKSSYATFESIAAAVRPALADNGLAMFHRFEPPPEGGEGRAPLWCRAVVMHADGSEISVAVPAPGVTDPNPQKAGSAMTYARRYSALALFGLAPSDDADGNDAPNAAAAQSAERSAVVGQIRNYVASAFNVPPARAEAALASAFNGSPNLGGGEWHAGALDGLRGLLGYLQTNDGHAAIKAKIGGE